MRIDEARRDHQARGIDPARGTVDVRLRIDPGVDFVRADMTVTATIVTGRRGQALVVPNDAILGAGDGSGRAEALRVRGGRVARVPLRLGLRGLAASEVVEGLEAGDEVVAARALEEGALPDDGRRVRIEGQPAPAAAGGDARGEPPVRLD